MVVCKFFLQGRCKFGDFCHFAHQINDTFNSNQNETSVLRQPNFGTTQPQPNFGTSQLQPAKSIQDSSSSAVDTATLVKSVVNDVTSAERGNQWPFSCYAPFRDKPAFPGFEDQSFEELRFAYCEAIKTASLEQYKQQVQLMIQQIQMKMKSLQTPSPDMLNLLKNIYDTPPSSRSGVFPGNTLLNQKSTCFGQVTNQNLFGKTQQQQTRKQTTSQSTFSMETNILKNTVQNSIFGGQTVDNNLLGTSLPSQRTSSNVFGKNSFASSANSIFGVQLSTPQLMPESIFGGNTNLTVTAPSPSQQSLFANQKVLSQSIPHNADIFSSSTGPQQRQTNIFTKPQVVVQNQWAPTNNFNGTVTQQKNTGSIFGQQSEASFGDNNWNTPFRSSKSSIQAHSSSIFGGSSTSSSSVKLDESLYSKLEDLTEEEIKWFESDDLDIMSIPEKPPTYHMCFKP